jgi:DinB superfamily
MTDDRNAAEYAAAIAGARQRLIGFADGCSDQDWSASPLDGDPRPVGVVADHVAHAYEYIAGWLRQILDGQAVKVTSEIVDGLNADHAGAAAKLSRGEVIDHLNRSGDVLIALIAGLDPGQLDADEGRIRLFAQISIRHADDHRAEIEAALGRPG